jgi:hypothetical protein
MSPPAELEVHQKEITFYRSWGWERKEPVCPEGPQNGLGILAERLKMLLSTSIPKFHRLPLKRHPIQTPAIGSGISGISLTPNSPLAIFYPSESEFLSIQFLRRRKE